MTSRSSILPTGQQSSAGRSAGSTANIRRSVLPSGLRVITQQMAGVRSTAVGVWVGVGSRHETPALHGCSHFLEHLLFKGTRTRGALDISIELDQVGGEFNAFTAKEYTCFHTRTLDEDLPVALDVLGDMLTSSLLRAEDLEAERQVILDEIAMHDDDPDDAVHNLFTAQAWGDTPLGRPIAGTTDSIASLTREQVYRFWRRHYRPATMVIAVAGNLDHDEVLAQVQSAFGRQGFLDSDEEPAVAPRRVETQRVRPGVAAVQRPFEQVNLVLGNRGITRTDPRRYALGVLVTALGGGTSSRLFQEVRERRGLAYSVYAFASQHADAGLVGVAAGCLPDRQADVLEVVRGELATLAASGLSAEEVALGQNQLRGGLILGLEDSGSRMFRLGRAEFFEGELPSLDDVQARVDAVTVEQVGELASDLFSRGEVLAVVGP